MEERVKISICVTIYNAAPFLERFLDSAVNQTFDGYEIVVVDNCSTDDSLSIAKKYEQAFPNLISVYQLTEHGHAGKGRNFAFQKARGAYIYWCDGGDIIHPKALSVLYDAAIKNNADVVRGHGIRMFEADGDVVRLSLHGKQKARIVSGEAAVMTIGTQFWLELIRRDLIEEYGAMPEEFIFEDIRYLVPIHSYAKKICCVDFPVYYWSRRGSSTTFTVSKELCVDAVEAPDYILSHCNAKYLKAAQFKSLAIFAELFEQYWQFFDLFIDYIKRQEIWIFQNEFIQKNAVLFRSVRHMRRLSDIEFPNYIYVNGFDGAPTPERLEELQNKVFHDGCEITVLSPESCDLSENEYVKRAYERGDMEFVGAYFALKHIYEYGGIFIHNGIRILAYFGYLKYQNAFFSLLNKTTYSDWIFGAPAGNEAIASLLNTYSDQWDKKQEYMSLSERIAIILTAKYGIPMDGKARLYGEIVSVLPPDLSVADTRFGNEYKKCAFEHDFSCYADDVEHYITIPRESLRVLMAPPNPVSKETPKSSRELQLEQELADLKKTNTWKMMMKVREIGDGPYGPFLKKIFRFFMKIRAKIKKKGA